MWPLGLHNPPGRDNFVQWSIAAPGVLACSLAPRVGDGIWLWLPGYVPSAGPVAAWLGTWPLATGYCFALVYCWHIIVL